MVNWMVIQMGMTVWPGLWSLVWVYCGVTGLRVPAKNCPAGHCILGLGVRWTSRPRIQCPAGQRILGYHVPP